MTIYHTEYASRNFKSLCMVDSGAFWNKFSRMKLQKQNPRTTPIVAELFAFWTYGI
jgi:hypothetical protein